MADFIKEKELEKSLFSIGVDEESLKYLMPKGIFRLLYLNGVKSPLCNIIKQEMLSLGGDAAVNKRCVSCTIDESDVLIMGTVRQIMCLAGKLREQIKSAEPIAREIETLLKGEKTILERSP